MEAVKFLLNKETDPDELAKQAVEAPAFSLTKVLGTAALIVAPAATVLVEALGTIELNAQHYVALAIGLFGFLAVAAAADVVARSVVTAAEKNAGAVKTAAKKNAEAMRTAAEKKAEAELDARSHLIRFQHPLPAREQMGEGDQNGHRDVEVLGVARGSRPYFLVKNDDEITWTRTSKVTFS